MYQLNHGAVYNLFDGAQKLFSYIYVPAGDQAPSDPVVSGAYYVNGWGADGITETFLHGRYAPPLQGHPAYFSVTDKPIAEIADPLGNIATTAYGNPTFLHWRFFDAFGLLTYETLPYYYFDDPLAFKGQSGAETYFFGGYDSYEGCNIPGLILMGYRWYNPSTGRFWTRDPQGYEGGINLYAFCRNNPVNHSDPMGLSGNVLDDIKKWAIDALHQPITIDPDFRDMAEAMGLMCGVYHEPGFSVDITNGRLTIKPYTVPPHDNPYLDGIVFMGMPSFSKFGTELEAEFALWLGRSGAGRKAATVITEETSLAVRDTAGRTIGSYDGGINKLVYEVKSVLSTDAAKIRRDERQFLNQSRYAKSIGKAYRVFHKGPLTEHWKKFGNDNGIIFHRIPGATP